MGFTETTNLTSVTWLIMKPRKKMKCIEFPIIGIKAGIFSRLEIENFRKGDIVTIYFKTPQLCKQNT